MNNDFTIRDKLAVHFNKEANNKDRTVVIDRELTKLMGMPKPMSGKFLPLGIITVDMMRTDLRLQFA